MKTNFTQKLLGLALSVFSISALAQCPTITNMNVTLGANGTATITPVLSGTVSSQTVYYWSASPSAYQTNGSNSVNGEFQFPSNGTYTVSLFLSDSTAGCWDTGNATLTISNMSANYCQANFHASTDSLCVTHFYNTSSGSNLTYQWYDMSNNGFVQLSTATNPTLSLTNGSYLIALYSYANGAFCDSSTQIVNVNCNPGGSSSCQASFYYYTDSLCDTHFINTSTNSGDASWIIDGMSISNIQNPPVALANGTYYATLYNYDPMGVLCDSITQLITVACNNSSNNSSCQANSQFYIFADSLNPGNYFAYNLSWATGTNSYLWNFGDGTTSTQQYPFHQYAVPGQYVVCLTVTGTSTDSLGNVISCSDTYCDSSSVQRVAAGFQMSQLNVIPQSVTGIKNNKNTIGLTAYPNPIADVLTIEISNSISTKLSYVLIDALGRVVDTHSIENKTTTINTSALEKGFYSLQLIDEKGNSLKSIKLVK